MSWLGENKRIALHFTPTSGSWLSLLEVFFGIIARQAIRVKDLGAIETFIDGWNERATRLDRASRRNRQTSRPRSPTSTVRH